MNRIAAARYHGRAFGSAMPFARELAKRELYGKNSCKHRKSNFT
jgi:hypothetical protein